MYKIGDISSTYCSGNNEAQSLIFIILKTIPTFDQNMTMNSFLLRKSNRHIVQIWQLTPISLLCGFLYKKMDLDYAATICLCICLSMYELLYLELCLHWFSFFWGGGGEDLDFSLANIHQSSCPQVSICPLPYIALSLSGCFSQKYVRYILVYKRISTLHNSKVDAK